MCLFEVGLWSVSVALLDNAQLFCFYVPTIFVGGI